MTEASALSRTLSAPDIWTEELCAIRCPDSALGEAAHRHALVLSYPPRKLAEWGLDLVDVQADLEQGLWVRPGQFHPGGDRYWLTGTRYQVEVLSKPASGAQWPIAFVLRPVRTPVNAIPRRAGRIYCAVNFAEVREEKRCDIGALHQEIQRAERYRAARIAAAQAVQEPRRDLRLVRHADLHGIARKRYGPLQALLALLALRATRLATSCDGLIAQPPAGGSPESEDPYMYVRIEESAGEFEDARVELAGAGLPVRTRVRNVSGRVLALDVPRRGEWRVGTPVTVTTIPRFAMKQHDIALDRFLKEQIEGDWDDLAALLCNPRALDLESRSLPPRFLCDEDPDEEPLNNEQRKAVAGALATPHGFVIQGPPGTGKTTVICEVVRQLIARGQRILMLAPQHVAVDEVLGRVGRKPGVRALRLAWEDSKVDEKLRCFLPDRVGGEFVAALRRLGPEDDVRWAALRAGLFSERAAVDRLLTAQEARNEAAARLADAESGEGAAQYRLDQARSRHARDIESGKGEIEVSREAADAAAEATGRVVRTEAEAWALFEANRQPVDELLSVTTSLLHTSAELSTAVTAEQDADERYTSWRQWWMAEQQRLADELAATEQPAAASSRAAADALARLQAASASLAMLPQGRGVWGRFADRIGIGVLARRRAAVERERARWAECDQDRQSWEVERQRLTGKQQRLNTEGVAWGTQLTAGLAVTRERLQVAQQEREYASNQWRQVTQAVTGESLAEPKDPDRVILRLEDVLSNPLDAVPLPTTLAPSEFGQAHELLRSAGWDRQQRTAEQQVAEDLLNAASHALAQTVAASEAEDEELAAALSSAAASVASRRSQLSWAEQGLIDAMIALGHTETPTRAELIDQRDRLDRRIRVLPAYPELRRRWLELVADRSDAEIGEEVGDALVRSVNLVCATTTGIAGGSADLVRSVDFDTLVVDEASRVIDSEFLIGAIRARCWILVGDEHQLPPYVEQSDEYHLHALAALYRQERGVAGSLDEAVEHLAELWKEDNEQRQFRKTAVLATAKELRASGDWPDMYRKTFAEAHGYLRGSDPDRELLKTMRDHLVRSLFERVTAESRSIMREPLVVQRRMIAPMAEIVRGTIYNGNYTSPSDADLRKSGVYPLTTRTFNRPITFLDTSLRGKEQEVGHGFINRLERAWIEKACRYYEREVREEVTVSILCFYLAQAVSIREHLKAPRYPGFRRLKFNRIDPIDKIQGQQSDLVFISFCRSQAHPGKNFGQWLQDLRRLNVACTRARRALVLVGHWDMLSRLRTFEGSSRFYSNLLGLFDPSSEHFRRERDFD